MRLAKLMEQKLLRLKDEAVRGIAEAADLAALEEVRVVYLARKGKVAQLMSGLGALPAEERARAGKLANTVKDELTGALNRRLEELKAQQGGSRGALDITLSATPFFKGRLHPITTTLRAIQDIFIAMGFEVTDGPEVETEYYNFEALNIPADHPSRDTFDTFYVSTRKGILLRSQTSTSQIRVMQKRKPPLQVIHGGKVYRPDAVDASHLFMFHQVEGFAVGEDVTFANLKAVLGVFARRMFGKKTRTRFRPHFFPFTEPSAEVDVSCIICGGKGCRVCGRKGWLEILGCGMVHPNVFKAVGYDPGKYTGFAFGMGVERIAMLMYGIDDIRLFYENDVRFLNQF